MTKVAIIDYGSGNVRSAHKAFLRAAQNVNENASVILTNDLEKIAAASHLVLPGVGAFADCARGIRKVDGLWELIDKRVRQDKIPFLGICVGMQLMAIEGREFEVTPGFGWINGVVQAIQPDDPSLKIPHMGWNTLTPNKYHPVLDGIEMGADGLHAYFVHSFHMAMNEADAVVATSDYGGKITAMVAHENIVGTQFHPEKSQELGLKLIENFIRWSPK